MDECAPMSLSAIGEPELVQRLTALHRDAVTPFEALVARGELTANSGAPVSWDDRVWNYRARKLWFCELRGADGKVLRGPMFKRTANIRPVTGSMANWMKCFIVHRLVKKRYAPTSLTRYLQPMRWLIEGAGCNYERLIRFNQHRLDRLVTKIGAQGLYGEVALYQMAREMAMVMNWSSRQGLLARRLLFKNPVPDPTKARLDVTTAAFARHREQRFPDDAFVDAVTAIKRKLSDDPTLEPKPGYDWIRVHAIPFKLALGLRIGELLTLPINALYEDESSGKLYLRVWTEKGEAPTLRYVPSLWAPAVRASYRALVKLCRPARTLAETIDSDGDFSFIERELRAQARSAQDRKRLAERGFDPHEYYYTRELAVIGFSHRDFLKANGGLLRDLLETTGHTATKWRNVVSTKRLCAWFETRFNQHLSRHYRENILEGESDTAINVDTTVSSPAFRHRQPLHQHLIVLFDKQLMTQRAGVLPLPTPMAQRHLWAYYASRPHQPSVFERFDIRDSRGEIFRLTPHQFRHWVTTSVQREGVNDMAIDLWMGRKVGQNRCYDHRTGKERAEAIREKYLQCDAIPDDYLGRKVTRMRLHDVDDAVVRHTVDDFIRVAHFTPWGLCSRDLAVVPCHRNLQCLKGFDGSDPCRHFHIDPTDTEAKRAIERLLKQYEHQLELLMPDGRGGDLNNELNLDEPLDQHIHHAVQIIRGCRSALGAFEDSTSGASVPIVSASIVNATAS